MKKIVFIGLFLIIVGCTTLIIIHFIGQDFNKPLFGRWRYDSSAASGVGIIMDFKGDSLWFTDTRFLNNCRIHNSFNWIEDSIQINACGNIQKFHFYENDSTLILYDKNMERTYELSKRKPLYQLDPDSVLISFLFPQGDIIKYSCFQSMNKLWSIETRTDSSVSKKDIQFLQLARLSLRFENMDYLDTALLKLAESPENYDDEKFVEFTFWMGNTKRFWRVASTDLTIEWNEFSREFMSNCK